MTGHRLGLWISLLLVVPGCEGPRKDPSPEVTVSAYLRAVAEGDGDAACATLTGEMKRRAWAYLRRLLPELHVASCEDGIRKLAQSLGGDESGALRHAEIAAVDRRGPTATVSVVGASSTVTLQQVDGRWYIASGPFAAGP